MMKLIASIFGFLYVVGLANAAGTQWPSNIKRCASNDPNLNKCVLGTSKSMISRLAKGVPAVGVPSLDPLRNGSFDVETKPGPVFLDLHASNVVVSGQSKVQMKKARFDKKTSTYFLEGYHNLVKMIGNYNVKGNILVFPLDSSGTFDLEIRGAFANHTLKLANNARAKGHGQVDFDLKNFKSMKLTVRDRILGEQGSAALNAIINENFQHVSDALFEPMRKVIGGLFGDALKPLTSKFAAKDFFPTTSTGRSEAAEVLEDNGTSITEQTPAVDHSE